jgi:ribosome assembly protein YihI (activator of Der GTPase)
MTEPIRPVGRSEPSTPPVPAVRRLTANEREQAARERARKRRRRRPAGTSSPVPAERPSEGGSLDLLA